MPGRGGAPGRRSHAVRRLRRTRHMAPRGPGAHLTGSRLCLRGRGGQARHAMIRWGLAALLLCSAASTVGAADEPCAASRDATILTSPLAPQPGAALRAIAVSERPLEADLVVTGPDGEQ